MSVPTADIVRVRVVGCLLIAMVFLLNGCGDGDPTPAIEEAPTSCTSSDECRVFCGVPSGTPVGTQDLVGTCDLDFVRDGCIVVVEQGEAVSAVCY